MGGIRHIIALALRAVGLFAALALPASVFGEQVGPPAYPAGYRLSPVALPAPGGRYPVGRRLIELARADGSPLPVIAWYPAANDSAPRAPYFTEDQRRVSAPAMARTFWWPATMLDDLGTLATHAGQDAPIVRGRFPLVIFSHGFLMYPQQNSALMERLAAAGYVVLSVAHPGDAADIPSSRGPLPTVMGKIADDPDPKAAEAYWNAPDLATQKTLLAGLWNSPRMQYMAARLQVWRDDVGIVANAVIGPKPSPLLHEFKAAVKPGHYALAGMSFGGSTSASACVRDKRCRAAINLDGLEFDQSLYDRAIGKPLLLIQSDWRAYPNVGPVGRTFTSYDLAYERWAAAGQDPDIHRYRLTDIRHMGMTDLILAGRNPPRDALLGTADGARATDAINAITLAFLDRYLARRPSSLADIAASHPVLEPHRAGETR